MNIDERLEKIAMSIVFTGFRWRTGDGEAPEVDIDVTAHHALIKSLLRDVIEEVKPERRPHQNSKLPDTSYHEWNACLAEMEAKQRELGL